MLYHRNDPWRRPADPPRWLWLGSLIVLAALLLWLALGKAAPARAPEAPPTTAQVEGLHRQLDDLKRQSDELGRRLEEDLRLLQFRQGMREEAAANGGDPAWVDYAWEVAVDYGVDPRWYLALISHESHWRNAKSKNTNLTVDMGPAQVNSGTWPYIADALGLTDPMDPRQNIRAGAYWFAGLVREQGGNYERALTAYNRGTEGLRRYAASRGTARSDYSRAVAARVEG